MTKKDIAKEFSEIKENIELQSLNTEDEGRDFLIYEAAIKELLSKGGKEKTLAVVEGIAEGKFATEPQHLRAEIWTLGSIIKKNVDDKELVSASFDAMKSMLNSVAKNIKSGDNEEASRQVNEMTVVPWELSYLNNYSSLTEQTDAVYEVYKNMMDSYLAEGLYYDNKNKVSKEDMLDYLQGRDGYRKNPWDYEEYDKWKDYEENSTYEEQVDAAWDIKGRLEEAKQRVYNKFTKKEIADYEKEHAEQAKREDAKYVEDLKKFVKEHDNPELRKKRHDEMDIAWDAKEIWDNAKKDFCKDMTDKEIAEWEKNLPQHLKEADAKYVEDLKKFVKERLEAAQKAEREHRNKMLNEAHQEKAEWTLQHRVYDNDKALEYAYNEHKDVAREPAEGEKAKEVSINKDVPERAVFIARVEGKLRA